MDKDKKSIHANEQGCDSRFKEVSKVKRKSLKYLREKQQKKLFKFNHLLQGWLVGGVESLTGFLHNLSPKRRSSPLVRRTINGPRHKNIGWPKLHHYLGQNSWRTNTVQAAACSLKKRNRTGGGGGGER